MAMETQAATARQIDADTALQIATGFLVEEVGDLLRAGEPHIEGDRWVMSIIAGNVVQGELGTVGTLCVDAASGRVLFSEKDRARVKAGARLLATRTSP